MHVATAPELRADSVRAAAGLLSRGVRFGDRVALVTPEGLADRDEAAHCQAEVLAVVLGCLRAGMVPVMINPMLTPHERDFILADCDPRALLEHPRDFRRLTSCPGSEPELADGPLGRPMHYTSGTTGRPKGVSVVNLAPDAAAEFWTDEQSLWGFESTDVSLVHGPLCHSGPLRFALSVVLAGGSVVLPGRFDADSTARALVEIRPTTAFVVPSHIQRLLALSGGIPGSPYRLLIHAGASCPEPLKRRLHAWAGASNVWEFYGSTEGQFTACHGPDWESRPGTVGRARAGRQLVIDNDVVWCAAPPFARFSYWRNPAATAAAWRETPAGPAFTVGDLGRLDDDGYLYLEGRREDLIVSGGVNVYPAEVELVLGAVPGVSEIAVFGVDDDRWGQRVCAAFTGTAEADSVAAHAARRLAGYKRPKEIRKLPDLPRTESGKIKRRDLATGFHRDPRPANRPAARRDPPPATDSPGLRR